MKQFFFTALLLLLGLTYGLAANDGTVHLSGRIANYDGDKVLLWSANDESLNQQLAINADGTFNEHIACQPAEVYLIFDSNHAGFNFYIEPGADIRLDLALRDSVGRTLCDVNYSGDCKDCYEYMKAERPTYEVLDAWPFSRLDTISFAQYREGLTQDMDVYKQGLQKLNNPNYRRLKLKAANEMMDVYLFRYARSKNANDPVLVNWVEGLDHNDPQNMSMAQDYLMWKMSLTDRTQCNGASYFDFLKQTFTNRQIINSFAQEYAFQNFKNTDSDMDEVYQGYMAFCDDDSVKAEATRLYEHYKPLKKGAPALDFTMQDAKGKTFSLKDFRGKAVYIDCWATWCGPCCAEIPYMEKLYEHFKNNKKVELISISLDSTTKPWLKKLAEDKPGWRQFICPDNFKSKLCQNYDIDAIPRFMMFDKKGRIISLDAPRPSDDRIIEWINKQL